MLGSLTTLERLAIHLGSRSRMTASELDVVLAAPRLRSISIRPAVEMAPATAASFRRAERLENIECRLDAIEGKFLAGLAGHPNLRRTYSYVLRLSEAALAAIERIPILAVMEARITVTRSDLAERLKRILEVRGGSFTPGSLLVETSEQP